MGCSILRFVRQVIEGRILQPPLMPFPRGLAKQVGAVADIFLARRRCIHEAWERYGSSERAFQRLAQLMRLCDTAFTAKHVASIYALSRRPPIDRIASSTAVQRRLSIGGSLRYDEFREAVARLSLVWQRSPGSGNLASHKRGDRRWPVYLQVGQLVQPTA